jgi:hypothetical protein
LILALYNFAKAEIPPVLTTFNHADYKPKIWYEGKSISKLQIVIEKKRMGIMTYKQHLFFNVISIKISTLAPGNLRHKILMVAFETTPTLLFQLCHRQESVPLKDNVLEGCLTWQAMFTIHGQHLFVDILCCRIFCPQKQHNTTLFYHGTRIQGGRHLVTDTQSLQSCAHQSLHVTIKLDSAAI